MGRRQSKSAGEADLKVRSIYCYLQRAGATRKIKKEVIRRERTEARRQIRNETP